MKRGKIIGAIVLVAAVALIIAERLGEPGDAITGNDSGGGQVTSARPPDGSGGAAELPAGVGPAEGETRVYTVDAAQSEVYWRIYRAGALASFGHSHVISIDELGGTVTLTDDLATTEWSIGFPVAGLVVDDPELRSRYGEEFESVPSEDDKAGTRTNMLTDRVLNGDVYRDIRLTGTGVNGSLVSAELPVEIEILGRTIEQTFPATITIGAESLTVEGEHRLTHADLGMEPFTAFGGAVAVGDDIDFSYRIHAVAGGQ